MVSAELRRAERVQGLIAMLVLGGVLIASWPPPAVAEGSGAAEPPALTASTAEPAARDPASACAGPVLEAGPVAGLEPIGGAGNACRCSLRIEPGD